MTKVCGCFGFLGPVMTIQEQGCDMLQNKGGLTDCRKTKSIDPHVCTNAERRREKVSGRGLESFEKRDSLCV